MTKKQILGLTALILSLLIAVSVFAGCNAGAPEAVAPDVTDAEETVAKTDSTETVEIDAEEESPYTDYLAAEQEAFETLFPTSMGIKDKTLDESAIANSITISAYNGTAFKVFEKDMGNGSYMHVAEGTTVQQFSRFLCGLLESGAGYYTSNKIGANFFVTMVTKTQIINAMFFKATREVRVVVDDRATFDLPGLASENVYARFGRASLTMVAIEETGWPGGMGFVYELSDGSFIVIDGGYSNRNASGKVTKSSANWLTKTLKKLAKDPENITIAAWVITHPHEDHYGAFIEMAESAECLEDITIEMVIYNNPAEEYLTSTNTVTAAKWIEAAIVKWKPEKLVKAHPGQVFHLRDAVITVYGSPDIVVPQDVEITNVNNLNTVTMVDYHGKRGLYLGDAQEIQNPIMSTLYNKEFKADILQLAHHGYGNTDAKDVYRFADPSIVLWPVGTRDYPGCANVGFNRPFFADGIDNHVALRENLTIRNFNTWEAEPRWDPTK